MAALVPWRPFLPCPVLQDQASVFALPCLPCRATITGHRAGQGKLLCPGKLCPNFKIMYFLEKISNLLHSYVRLRRKLTTFLFDELNVLATIFALHDRLSFVFIVSISIVIVIHCISIKIDWLILCFWLSMILQYLVACLFKMI